MLAGATTDLQRFHEPIQSDRRLLARRSREPCRGNWKIHRNDLAERIRKLGVITWEAAKGYEAVDAKLAEALRRQDAKHETGPR